MNRHAISVLELGPVFGLIEEKMPSELGLRKLRKLAPTRSSRVVRRRLARTKEAMILLGSGETAPLDPLKDPGEAITRASASALLTGEELVTVASFLAEVRRLKTFLSSNETQCPDLIALLRGCVDEHGNWLAIERLETRLWRCLDVHGKVRDEASKRLGTLRTKLKISEEQIRDVAHETAKNPLIRDDLQEPVIHYRGGKPVLPVKTGSRDRVKGVVRDVSASGATVFVEPFEAAKLGRRRERLLKEEEREERKIRGLLSKQIGDHDRECRGLRAAIGYIELAFAAARFALDRNGVCAEVNEQGVIDLKEMRHPLLDEDCVPLTLWLSGDNRTVLITGPNTGGKTVALKTAGLAVLMTACGLPVLSKEGTVVPVVRDVLADIGDEQSIEQSLSTFSGHMANIVSVMKRVSELEQGHCLVLLDELGAGTDPLEGEALGCAIMEWLHSQGTPGLRLVATSHFAGLKELAASSDGMMNARMEFNALTLEPTFELTMGASGSSQAFPVAERLGLCDDVMSRAVAYLGPDRARIQKLMSQIERERSDLRAARDDLEREVEHTERLAEERHRRTAELEEQMQREKERIRAEAEEIFEWSRKELRQARENNTQAAAQRRHVALTEKLAGIEKAISLGHGDQGAPPTLNPGDEVVIKGIGVGILKSLNPKDGTGIVETRGAHVEVPLVNLELKSEDSRSEPIRDASGVDIEEVNPELKIIGCRARDAQHELERYLDRAALAELGVVRIIHGLGRGVLKEMVRDIAGSHPRVARLRTGRPEEGGHGVTVIELE
jgi:DNA mismatch repair protein MutS2